MMHPKQFILSRTAYTGDGFISMPYGDDYILSHHKDLAVFSTADGSALLLGDAWQVDPALDTPENELTKLTETLGDAIQDTDVYRMEESWCGRYVLIVRSRIYPDTGCLLNVFYSEQGIASSCALLAEQLGLSEKIYPSGKGCNWLLGILTQYNEIRKLLPTQVYDLADGTLTFRDLKLQRSVSFGTTKELTAAFADLFRSSLQNMRARFPDAQVYVSVTGGFDSRAVLALAEYSGIDYQCYTQKYDTIPQEDIATPQQLCSLLGRKHLLIDFDERNYSEARKAAYEHHTAGLANDGDKRYYIYDQFAPLHTPGKDTILLRGNVWETANEDSRQVLPTTMDKASLLAHYNIKPRSRAGKSTSAYTDWCASLGKTELSAANQFYLDQRIGNWLSNIETGFDLLEHVKSFHPVNSRLFLCLLLRYPRERRIIKLHEHDIICHVCPQFRGIPYTAEGDPSKSTLEKLFGKLRTGFILLQVSGPRHAFSTFADYLRIKRETKTAEKTEQS